MQEFACKNLRQRGDFEGKLVRFKPDDELLAFLNHL
jgi:hypothetical protein